MPRFSVIMPAFLGPYKTQASNPIQKFDRAVGSLQYQTFADWELIIVSDGCELTWEASKEWCKDVRIKCVQIPKQDTFSSTPRNKGLSLATGELITYLDTDDCLGMKHLQSLHDAFTDELDWIWYDDYRALTKAVPVTRMYYPDIEPDGNYFTQRNPCDIEKLFHHGTSNITHRRSLGVLWYRHGYKHDYYFIQDLKKASERYAKVDAGKYIVCHIPKALDV